AGASDNCISRNATCLPGYGSSFGVGTTPVTCTTWDDDGHTNSCTFTVTVRDLQPPTITCPANVTTNTAAGQCSAVVNYAVPTASDNCSGVSSGCTPASGST